MEPAKPLGHVSKACKLMGYSLDSFYLPHRETRAYGNLYGRKELLAVHSSRRGQLPRLSGRSLCPFLKKGVTDGPA
ncbi:MAG: hypothetical protein C4293_19680 [Nitrospiraceae bacterium]